jgi:glucuronate isomerase
MHRTLIILSLLGALAAQGRQAGTDMLQSSEPEPQGQLLADINLLGEMVKNICFNNARDYFAIELN